MCLVSLLKQGSFNAIFGWPRGYDNPSFPFQPLLQNLKFYIRPIWPIQSQQIFKYPIVCIAVVKQAHQVMKVHQLLPTFYQCRVQNHHHRHQPHQFRLRLHHQSTVMTWSYLDQSGRGRIQRSTPHLQRHLVYDATQRGRFEQQRTSVHSSQNFIFRDTL